MNEEQYREYRTKLIREKQQSEEAEYELRQLQREQANKQKEK